MEACLLKDDDFDYYSAVAAACLVEGEILLLLGVVALDSRSSFMFVGDNAFAYLLLCCVVSFLVRE